MTDLDKLCIDTVRVLTMDAVQKANSGHPGAPMALAPLGYVLWREHLQHDPADPAWLDRDRFVLSAGHASMFLYSLLHLTGYDLGLEELEQFRQWDSRTPGHPEVRLTPGVETTTGPLGQGVANSVGMAMAERWMAARFNRPGHEIIDHHTYAVCSDGDLMEGLSHEAADLAGHLGLGKLIWIFDDNRITIEGDAGLATSIDQAQRFAGYGWHVLNVHDGTDLTAIRAALEEARAETGRPTLIVLRTVIAQGSANKAGHESTHGAPLGQEEVRASKEHLGYPSLEPFHIEDRALDQWRTARKRGASLHRAWKQRWAAYETAHPEPAAELASTMAGELAADWEEAFASGTQAKTEATRSSSGTVLQGLAARIPNFMGGSADLGPSNKTELKGVPELAASTPEGRNIHFGIREHAMGGILNGMALHGGIRPYGGTFLIFSDYMRPSIRLAGLMQLPVAYVFTHDSIGVGEDGPTHQPIEQLAALRAIPNVMDLRPGDGPETEEAWRAALRRTDGPAFLALTRQTVDLIDRTRFAGAEGLHRGAYTLAEASTGAPEAILIASGSELGVAMQARERLEEDGVPTRVVSMPSWFLFRRSSEEYRQEVLPRDVPVKVSLEAGSTFGWAEWVGTEGTAIGIDHFGASAPAGALFEEFGITASAVVDAVATLASRAASSASV